LSLKPETFSAVENQTERVRPYEELGENTLKLSKLTKKNFPVHDIFGNGLSWRPNQLYVESFIHENVIGDNSTKVDLEIEIPYEKLPILNLMG